ncbi:MAG: 6-phosphogluconolactonase [Candidatus Dormibacteria bacterium]
MAEHQATEEPRLCIEPDSAALAAFAAKAMAREIAEAVAARGEAVVALPGGSTPRDALELLAQQPGIPWSRVVLVPGDERLVPVTDPESNEGMIRRSLLARLPGSTPILVGWEVKDGLGPETVLGRFEGQLLGLLPRAEGELRFDLVVLGMGDDGHTASLFPGQEYSDQALVLATRHPSGQTRLTLGPAVLRSARRVRFLVAGAEKAATLAQVVAGPYDPVRLPAQLIARRSPGCEIWCDQAAASLIPSPR